MKPINPRNHCQHGLPDAQDGQFHKPARLGILGTIVSVLSMLVLLAVAYDWDMRREMEDALIDQHITDVIAQKRRDEVWLKRMSEAYARGRSEALNVSASSPEYARLAVACATLR